MSYKARCDVTDIVRSLTTIKGITAPLNFNIDDYDTNIFYIVLSLSLFLHNWFAKKYEYLI